MAPRNATILTAGMLLALGLAGPSVLRPVDAPRTAAAAPSGPAVGGLVFVDGIPPAPRPARAAARPLPLTVVDDRPAVATGEALPPIPVPEGWVPAPAGESRAVLGLEDPQQQEEGAGPLFAVVAPGADDEAPAGVAGPAEEAVETASVETVRYYDTVEVETEVIELGTPMLVIEGYSSWGCGPFPAVRSSRVFDPCAVPPAGACWEPVPYDPCWNPCCDPDWRSWDSFARACDERDHSLHHGPVGLEVVYDGGGAAHPGTPRPPAPRPVHPVPPAPAPAPAPVASGHGATTLHLVSSVPPAAPAPGSPATSPAGREVGLQHVHGSGEAVASSSEPPSAPPPHRLVPGVRHRVAAPEPPPESAAIPSPGPAHEGAVARLHPVPRERDEQPSFHGGAPAPAPARSAPEVAMTGGDAPAPAAAPVPRPSMHNGGRREETPAPAPRQVESPRPAPESHPAPSIPTHNGGGARDRSPEPPPEPSRGHHK